MIPDAFLLRLVASSAAGFGVVALVTALADYSGEGPAGFIGGLPWSGPVSLLAIGFTETSSAAVKALTLFPLGLTAAISFLLFYAFPRKMRFLARMFIALILWALASTSVALWAPDSFGVSAAAGLGVSLLVLYARSRVGTERINSVRARPGVWRTVLRGLLGGIVVAVVVIIGAVGGPLTGGVFAGAPVAWSSSLYVTERSRGLEFSRSLTWEFMKTGVLTVIPYAIAAYYLFPVAGIWLGTLLSYVAISPLAYVAWKLIDHAVNEADWSLESKRH